MATNPNIIRLLEMLEAPEAYSEQDIRTLIDSDEETRRAYQLMVEAKQGYIHRQGEPSIDVQAAWRRFCESEKLKVKSESSFFILRSSFQKVAASVVGVLFVSGLAFAAIHLVRQGQKTKTAQAEQTETVASTASIASTDTLGSDTATVQPVIYDNVPLEEMLPEIAAHYGATVSFANDEARQLRFRFVWNPQQGIGSVVSDLNQFERLTVTIKNNQITVK